MKKNKSQSLNILLIIGWPLGQGGHINSTLALSKPLVSDDSINKVHLLAPKGEKVKYFTDAQIKHVNLPNPSNLILFRLIGFFYIIYYAIFYKTRIIHAMDYKCLVPTVMSNLVLRRVLVFTKAGGQPLKIKLPVLSHLVVFSKELLDHYKSNFYEGKITLIKERLDLGEFKNNFSSKELKRDISIFIAMRLCPAKSMLLKSFFEEIRRIDKDSCKVNVIIAGDGELKEKCEKESEEISKDNSAINFKYLGQINNKREIYQYYANSDITVGHGRGIMEAMAIGKPVVLLGFDKVTSVLVNASNVNQIADYNFSGRNIISNDNSISLAQLINRVDRKELMNDSGQFALNYITDNYSSTIGALKLKRIYLESNRQNIRDIKLNLKWIFQRFLGK